MKNYPEKDGKRVWLSDDEVEQLIHTQPNGTVERIGKKLAAQAGLRRKAVTRVTPNDVVESERGTHYIRIWEEDSKTGKYRETPIPEDLYTRIDSAVDLLDIEPEEQIVDVTPKTLYRWVQRSTETLYEETGDEGWQYVDVHDLRRTWGTRLLEQGVLPSVVMSWGGWDDWSTFREHYLGEFSPEVLEREREKVDFLAQGDPIKSDSTSHTLPSNSNTYSD